MALASPVVHHRGDTKPPAVLFQSLIPREAERRRGRVTITLGLSLLFHAGLLLVMVVVPLLYYDVLPPADVLRTFFVTPLEVAPPPPPPPPPAPGPRAAVHAAATPPPVVNAFVAPIEVPAEIKPEETLDLGVEGGVPGGVEGGVPGGVVGGVVGGLPAEPPAPPKVVRIGGLIVAPKLVHKVDPVYPELARLSRLSAVIIIEARVDTKGHVVMARVLRGQQLLDEAALDAVKQWRYQPLLLNGEPTEFILTVTVVFSLKPGPS